MSGSPESCRFAELMDAVRRGESAALAQVMSEYGAAIRREVRFSLLDARLRRVVDESDVFQSVMVRFCVGMWGGKYTLDEPEQLMQLLKTMARNRVTDLVRYWTAQRRDVRRSADMETAAEVEGLGSRAPARTVVEAELLRRVQARMTDRDRVVAALRAEKKTWAEISEALGDGTSPEAIRKQHERTLDRIARELDLSTW